MKKLFLIAAFMVAMASFASAITPIAYAPGTLANSCSAVTTTGECTPLYLPGALAIGVTWQLSFDTGTASSVSVTLRGSNDNSSWTVLDTNTSTSNNSRSLTVTAYKYLECNVATYSLGTTNNLTCALTVNPNGGTALGVHGTITPGDCTSWFNNTTLQDAGACGGGSGITSINGDTTAAQTIQGTASQIGVSTAAGTTTISSLAPGANHDLICSDGSHFLACGTGAIFYTSSTLSTPNLSITGTTPGASQWVAGTGNIPPLTANSAGFAAPTTGGTAYLIKFPGTAPSTSSFALFAASGTGDNVLETAMTYSTALPTGTTVATPTAGDNSTKVATTAYVDKNTLTSWQIGNNTSTGATFQGTSSNNIRGDWFYLSQPVTFSNIYFTINTTEASNAVYGAAIVKAKDGTAVCYTDTGVQLGANASVTVFPCHGGAVTAQAGEYIILTTSSSATGKYGAAGSAAMLPFHSNAVAGCTASAGVFNFSSPCTISISVVSAAISPSFVLH